MNKSGGLIIWCITVDQLSANFPHTTDATTLYVGIYLLIRTKKVHSTMINIILEAQRHVFNHKGISPSPSEVGPPETVFVETSLNWRDDQFLCVELSTALVGEWSVLPVHEFALVSQLEDDHWLLEVYRFEQTFVVEADPFQFVFLWHFFQHQQQLVGSLLPSQPLVESVPAWSGCSPEGVLFQPPPILSTLPQQRVDLQIHTPCKQESTGLGGGSLQELLSM